MFPSSWADLPIPVKQFRLIALAIALVTIVLAAPWLFTLAGDAQVHLAVAEQFSHGHPFQYNQSEELVVASTSPFWTMLLTCSFVVLGSLTPLLLKIVVTVIWVAVGYLIYRTAQDLCYFRGYALLAIVGLWLTQTTITGNALGGMENILSALHVLWISYLCIKWRGQLITAHSLVLGFLLGWALLTRPDGGFFAAGVIGISFLFERIVPANKPLCFWKWLKQVGLLIVTALVVLLPWYAFQYNLTTQVVSDSAIARVYTGRRGSLALVDGILYFHPKPLITLFTAFSPLMAGLPLMIGSIGSRLLDRSDQMRQVLSAEYPQILSLLIGIVGLLFYSFVVGADSFGRYFLPIFPFYFLGGIAGLNWGDRLVRRRLAVRVPVLLLTAVIFLLAVSGVDFYRRVMIQRFDSGPILTVIYGPAAGKYFSFNLGDTVKAAESRAQHTAELKRALGVTAQSAIRFAVTEVQLRYFVDDSVTILSLDGRTSARLLDFVDWHSGIPDFAGYLLATRPDFVHVAQWCYIGDWRAAWSKSTLQQNLVCDWQNKISQMQIGEAFEWEGMRVIYVAPQIVQIEWKSAYE